MGLENTIEKLDDYYKRLAQNKVGKIKPDHVSKVLNKLRDKERKLIDEIGETQKTHKRERLEAKLSVVKEQIRRGEWLQGEIDADVTEKG